ncbi:MAG TPA: YafY family protein [Bacteroidia bacterium]|nr:YafY family protein [Bacteroidia bacterium]
MNRLTRVTAILIQLQSKRVVKAQDIAERFSISLRTVYRDIRTLEEAGIPLIGEAGVGYSLIDGYKLPPVMFTTEEATAFLTAEKLIEKLTDDTTEEWYKSAMYKIKAVLRSTEKDSLETIDENIQVIENRYLPKDKAKPNALLPILKSISAKNVLTIDYFANHSQEKTKRNIEPVGIFYLGNYWHLIAYCYLRNDYRNFRIDRISHILQTNLSFKKQHPSLKTYLKQISKEKELHTVIIRFDKKILRYFGDQKYYNGFVSQKEAGEQIEMTFLTESLEGFARWFMMYGDFAEIIRPGSLFKRVKQIATVISKK